MCSWCFRPDERLRVKQSDSKLDDVYIWSTSGEAFTFLWFRPRRWWQNWVGTGTNSSPVKVIWRPPPSSCRSASPPVQKQASLSFVIWKKHLRPLFPQELTWSHAHVSSKLNVGCGESVWPELLLQSNMEKVPRPSSVWTFLWTPSGLKPSFPRSLTRSRRSSPPWSSRPTPSRPTWRDWEEETSRWGPSLVLTGPVWARTHLRPPCCRVRPGLHCQRWRCPRLNGGSNPGRSRDFSSKHKHFIHWGLHKCCFYLLFYWLFCK